MPDNLGNSSILRLYPVRYMCGIAGAVNFNLPIETAIEKMGHRGPDGNGSFVNENVSLIHLRLAILDIAGGIQPMSLRDRYVIVFNGEIYNHLEVRKHLDLSCQTNSDTETILAAYEKCGEKCLDYFDGMFAFCIYDTIEQSLFLARDRAGKKPLYFYEDGKSFVFASELNLLRACLDVAVNEEALALYLRFGSLWPGQTPYLKVKELEAASYLRLNARTLSFTAHKWWHISDHYQESKYSLSEALEQVDHLLQRSVERRLESSDLEVGSFLSGGIDSGLVTAMAALKKNKLKTFTVSFDGAFNEAPLARLVAEKYGTEHNEINISLDGLKNDIENILAQYGEPFFDSSAIPSWYVSKAAKEYVTVILNGDGADELFAGYRRHLLFSKFNFFQSPKLVKLLAGTLDGVLPEADNKKSAFNYFRRMLFLASRKDAANTFAAAGSDIFEGYENRILIDADRYTLPMKQINAWVSGNNHSGLKQLMHFDFNITLFSDFLVKMDIATMAHSLEGRSPFLGKELLEFAPGLADTLKIKGKQTKYLLRQLAENYLPNEIIHQPKRGFEVPLKHWVNNDLKDIIHDYLLSPDAFYPHLIEASFIKKLLDKKISMSEEKRAKALYTIFALEVWYKKCFNRG
jgi:asparagine synthase (glutamine-hydrolysing)